MQSDGTMIETKAKNPLALREFHAPIYVGMLCELHKIMVDSGKHKGLSLLDFFISVDDEICEKEDLVFFFGGSDLCSEFVEYKGKFRWVFWREYKEKGVITRNFKTKSEARDRGLETVAYYKGDINLILNHTGG